MEKDIRKNPGLLKLELYCLGMRLDRSCNLAEDASPILRIRGGLGSGLEAKLPGDLYINIPVEESFAKKSPYILKKENGQYVIYKDEMRIAPIRLLPEPKFYNQRTSSGRLMKRIGAMQGTYIGIYPTRVCGFWEMKKNCRFCSVGLNLGEYEEKEKSVADVLEVVRTARKELDITFVHFNTGYYYPEENYLDELIPYIKAVKKETGLLIGVQTPPDKDWKKYDLLKKLGVNHVSFCIELYDPQRFSQVCPGKAEYIGQERYLETIAYCSRLFGKGRVAGEIVAGLEPAEDSISAVEHFAEVGAVSTVCVFRPTVGTPLEDYPPPQVEEMIPVFRRMYEVCLEKGIPAGVAPNVHVSLVLLPDEGVYFLDNPEKYKWGIFKMKMLHHLFNMYFRSRLAFKHG
jgi:hypothetical protein